MFAGVRVVQRADEARQVVFRTDGGVDQHRRQGKAFCQPGGVIAAQRAADQHHRPLEAGQILRHLRHGLRRVGR